MDDPNIEKRTASGIAVNLSSYLITGSLAVLGAQAVVVTFVLDKRDHLLIFALISILAFVSLIGGIVVGGKGIYELGRRGYDGTWDVVARSARFNLQALLTLAGVLLVAISTLLGDSTAFDEELRIMQGVNAARIEIAHLQGTVDLLERKELADHEEIEHLSNGPNRAPISTRKATKAKP